jgi:hypothetical protein
LIRTIGAPGPFAHNHLLVFITFKATFPTEFGVHNTRVNEATLTHPKWKSHLQLKGFHEDLPSALSFICFDGSHQQILELTGIVFVKENEMIVRCTIAAPRPSSKKQALILCVSKTTFSSKF